jgi:hypothetical protein
LHALREIESDGVDLIFNTPNSNSLPGYLKMGWQRVGTVKPLIKVINYPRFLIGLARAGLFRRRGKQNGSLGFLQSGLPGAGELLEGKEADTLLQEDLALHDETLLSTKRTREYLEWRYAQHPGYDYRSLVERHSGKSVCAIIARANKRFGLREVMLNELWANTTDASPIRSMFRRLRRLAKADYIIAHFPEGSSKHRLLRRCGFYQVPHFGMNFVAKAVNTEEGEGIHRQARWGLSLGDLEFF